MLFWAETVQVFHPYNKLVMVCMVYEVEQISKN